MAIELVSLLSKNFFNNSRVDFMTAPIFSSPRGKTLLYTEDTEHKTLPAFQQRLLPFSVHQTSDSVRQQLQTDMLIASTGHLQKIVTKKPSKMSSQFKIPQLKVSLRFDTIIQTTWIHQKSTTLLKQIDWLYGSLLTKGSHLLLVQRY